MPETTILTQGQDGRLWLPAEVIPVTGTITIGLAEAAPEPSAEVCRLCCRPATKDRPIFGGQLDYPDPTCGHGSFLVHFACYCALNADRYDVFGRIVCPVCGCVSFYT